MLISNRNLITKANQDINTKILYIKFSHCGEESSEIVAEILVRNQILAKVNGTFQRHESLRRRNFTFKQEN